MTLCKFCDCSMYLRMVCLFAMLYCKCNMNGFHIPTISYPLHPSFLPPKLSRFSKSLEVWFRSNLVYQAWGFTRRSILGILCTQINGFKCISILDSIPEITDAPGTWEFLRSRRFTSGGWGVWKVIFVRRCWPISHPYSQLFSLSALQHQTSREKKHQKQTSMM